jgi:hypothetical protein
MSASLKRLAYEIELQPGEKLTLPPPVVDTVGAGRWIATVESADESKVPIRNHGAFLNGYGAQDEGLYDDCR